MTEHAVRLHELMSHAPKTRDVAIPVCRMICNAPEAEQAELFYRFLLEFKHNDSDESRPVEPCFTEADVSGYYRICRELLHEWMAELQAEYPEENAFHAALWQKISALSNETLRTMMVAVCGESPDLPYLSPSRFQLGAHYTNESFKEAVHQTDPVKLQLIQHILNQDSPHVAQDAAALLPILEACQDRQERVMLLTVFFLAIHDKIQIFEIQKMLHKAADEALDKMIQETIAEYED